MNFTKKIRKMKRLAFFVIFISLFLGTQAAWGSLYGGNEVKNGDFQTGDLSNWTSSGNQIVVTDYYSPGDYYAWLGSNQTGSIYQVIDESQYSGWNLPGTAKLWSFKSGNDQFQAGSSVRFALYYYPSNPTGQPAFDPNNPTGWIIFLDHTCYNEASKPYETQGTIDNFRPRWVAVSIQMSTGTDQYAQAVVDNVSFGTLTAGLVSYWSFNACTATDDSGNGHDGTLYGPTCVPGKIGKAFHFDGVSNYIEVPHPGYLANGTVAGWVYFTSIPEPLPYAGLFWFSICTGPIVGGWDYLNFGVHPGWGNTLMFGIWDSGLNWQWAISPVVPQAGQWYYLAGVWGSEGLKIYINGVLKGTFPYTGGVPLASTLCLLGVDGWGDFMDGIIDEVRIYNRVLTDAEIAHLAQIAPSLPALLLLLD